MGVGSEDIGLGATEEDGFRGCDAFLQANQFSVSFVQKIAIFFNTMPRHLACMNVQIPFTGFPIFFVVKPLRGAGTGG